MHSRWLVFFTLLSASAIVRAESSSVDARRHYEEGNTAYSLGDFAHAVEEYKAAYKAKPDPAFLYNIAQAYRLANDPSNALFFYRSFLRNLPTASNRREVEDRIVKLEAQLAARDALVKQPPNSTIPPVTSGGRVATSMPPAAHTTPAAAPVEPPPIATPPPTPPPSLTPQSTELAPASETPGVLISAPPPARATRTPVYKKWWLWTAVGIV